MAPYDTLSRYTDAVERGTFDTDLGPDDRAAVVGLLRMACAILADYGGTPAADLARMVHDPYTATPAVNTRVREIIAGCLAGTTVAPLPPVPFAELPIGASFSFLPGGYADRHGYVKRSARGWRHPVYGNGRVGSIRVQVELTRANSRLLAGSCHAAPARHPDFRRTVTVYRDGWTGEIRTATYAGRCILCGRRTYDDDGGNDPRGPMGDHAASPLDPAEYGATGRTVPACSLCLNDTGDRYARLLRRAERAGAWRYTEPADPVAECFTCGAPIRLRGADGGPYRGWAHTGPATFHRPTAADTAAARAAGAHPSYAPIPHNGHDGIPRNAARPGCPGHVHHFSGSWCVRCGGWG